MLAKTYIKGVHKARTSVLRLVMQALMCVPTLNVALTWELGDSNINKEFQEIRKPIDKIFKSLVEFMDDKIGLAINKLCEIRGKTLMSSENPSQRLKRRKLNLKKRPDKRRKLLDFKLNIRSTKNPQITFRTL